MPTLESVLPPQSKAAIAEIKPVVAEPAKPAEPAKIIVEDKSKKRVDPIAARIAAVIANDGKEPEPVKPAEPAAAADPDSDDAIKAEVETKTQRWEPGQKKAFTDLRYSERDARRAVKALEGKLAAAEAAGKNTTELEGKLKAAEEKLVEASKAPVVDPAVAERLTAAEKKAADLEQELHVAAVERTEEFANAVTKPKKQIEESVAVLAKKYDTSPRSLMTALYGTDEEQAEAVEKMTGPEQTKFYSLALKAQELDARADTLRSNAAEALTKITAKRASEQEQTAAGRKKEFTEAHTAEWKTLVEALPILGPVDGTDEITVKWTKSLADARVTSATMDFDALTPAQKASVAARVSVFPNVVGALQSREAALAETQTKLDAALVTIAKFEANRPGGEHTPKDGGDDKPTTTLTGAKGTTDLIQKALGRG